MARSPYGETDKVSPRQFKVKDKDKLTKRMEKGAYKGLDDSQLERQKTGKKKKKKVSSKAKELASARSKYQKPRIENRAERQAAIERERIREQTISVTDVSPADQADFTEVLDGTAKRLRNFMLKKLAPRQIAASIALDTVAQELNIILDNGVNVNMVRQFERINMEVALLAMTKAFCRIHKLDKETTRKVINAKIEMMKPLDNPRKTPADPRRAPAQRVTRGT